MTLKRRSPRLGIGAVLIIAAFVFAGCGSSSKTDASTTTTVDKAKDATTAQSLLITQADMPAGWTSSPHEKDPSDTTADQKLATCTGASDPTTDSADVDGPDFALGDAQVSSGATLAPDKATFDKDVAALTGSKYVGCVSDLFKTTLQDEMSASAPGAVVSDVQVADLPTTKIGDVTKALRLTFKVQSGTQTFSFYGDVYQFGKDRAEVSVTFLNIGAPFDPAVEKAVMDKAAAKLNAF